MHPNTGYVDQDPSALRLSLIEGEFDLTRLTTYATCTTKIAGIGVTATVIGASHIVALDVEGHLIHEMFACVSPPEYTSWTLEELKHRAIRLTPHGVVSYEFSVQDKDWQGSEPPELTRLINAADRAADRGEIGLVQEFPANNLAVTPKTVIHCRADGDGRVNIETAHSYPNVPKLVTSRTLVQRV